MTLSRPATALRLAMGTVCNSYKIRGRKLKTEGRPGKLSNENTTMTSHPNDDEWTAEDLANQRRISDEIEKSIHRMHMRMLVAMLAVGALLAVAIHFLGKP